jgi:hypothetical protein
MPGRLANGCQEVIGGSTLLYKRDRPRGLCPSSRLRVIMDAQNDDRAR